MYKDAATLINEVTETVPGWTPPDQLLALYTLVVATSSLEGDLVELGSWCGRSTVVIAHALASQTGNRSRVLAVDLFPEWDDWFENADGSYSFQVAGPHGGMKSGYVDQTVWREPYLRDIAPVYERYGSIRAAFDQSLDTFGVKHLVTAVKGDSSVLQSMSDLRVRLAFVDADHSYEAVTADIRRIEPLMESGGWITFDDAFSVYDGVDRAIEQLVIGDSAFHHGQQLTRKFFAAQKV